MGGHRDRRHRRGVCIGGAEVIIGKRYRVPAVLVAGWLSARHGFNGWLPIIGPMHEDAEIINFPYLHYHVDWRFAPQRAINLLLSRQMPTRSRPEFLYGTPIMACDTGGVPIVMGAPTLKHMTYKRELPPFPRPPLTIKGWPEQLAAKFACARLIDGKCPHRGIPVSAMRRDGDILECPGHGLRWNAVTGRAVHDPPPPLQKRQRLPHSAASERVAWTRASGPAA